MMNSWENSSSNNITSSWKSLEQPIDEALEQIQVKISEEYLQRSLPYITIKRLSGRISEEFLERRIRGVHPKGNAVKFLEESSTRFLDKFQGGIELGHLFATSVQLLKVTFVEQLQSCWTYLLLIFNQFNFTLTLWLTWQIQSSYHNKSHFWMHPWRNGGGNQEI